MSIALLAHAGHGATEGNSLHHYISEPAHLLLFVVGIATMGVIAWMLLRPTMRRQRQAK